MAAPEVVASSISWSFWRPECFYIGGCKGLVLEALSADLIGLPLLYPLRRYWLTELVDLTTGARRLEPDHAQVCCSENSLDISDEEDVYGAAASQGALNA